MPFREERVVHSISEIIVGLSQDVRDAKESFWYRGHSNKEWKLIPSIYRSNVKRTLKEMHLLKQFKQDGISLFPRPAMQSYEWLFVMRHYRVPTRLLDWSESPLVATYFAVEKDPGDGALWILRPIHLNKEKNRVFIDVDVSLPSFEEDPQVMNAYSPSTEFESQTVKLDPIAFIYPRNIPRMQAQLSVYTIHHLNKIPLEEIGDQTHIWRYIIPRAAKSRIRKELSLLGITQFQLFPEAESIGRKLAEGAKKWQ